MKNINTQPFWRKITSYLLVSTFVGQSLLPSVVIAAEVISAAEIQAEVNANQQFESQISSDFQFVKSAQIEPTSQESSNYADQTIEDLYNKLKTHAPEHLESHNYTQWVPIAGEITIMIPLDKTDYPLHKRIGDRFVQSRLISSQVKRKIGRAFVSSAYTSSSKQIEQLYGNTFELTKNPTFTYQLGDAIPEASVEALNTNFIWPEFRVINGDRVLVPVVHLTDATIAARDIAGNHTVEFVASNATFKSAVINNSDIKLKRDTVFSTLNDLVIGESSSITIDNSDVKIYAGVSFTYNDYGSLVGMNTGTLYNYGQINSERNVSIVAGNYIQKTLVHRFQSRDGYGDRLGNIASINAGAGISIQTYGDIMLEGANVNGGNGSIVFNADGSIYIGSVALASFSEVNQRGFDRQTSEISYFQSQLTTQQNIALMAAGVIEIIATNLTADEGVIQLLASQGVYIGNEFNEFQSSRSGEVGNVTLQEQEFQTIAIRSALEAGKGVLIASDFGDITLKATAIKSGDGTQINALNGKVNLLLAKEQDHYFLNKVTEGFWRIKTETQTDTEDTAVYNSIVGGVKIQATHGVTLEIGQEDGVTLQDSLAMFEQTDELAWMAEAYNDPELAGNIELVYQELVNIHEYDKSSTLSPAAMAIIAIAVAVAMGPAGAGLIGSGGSIGAVGFVSAPAMQAGALSLATQAASSLANGNNLGETLRALTSSDGIRSLATAMITAGALSYVGEAMGDVSIFGDASTATTDFAQNAIELGNQATQMVVETTVSTGISTIINGGDIGDFADSFKSSLLQAGVQSVGEYLSSSIGEAYKDGDINNVIRYLSHAGAGCVIGLATSETGGTEGGGQESCLTGAGGAVVGELVADAYKANKLDEFFTKEQERAKLLGEAGFTDAQIAAFYKSDSAQVYFNKEVAKLTAAGVDLAKLSGGLAALAAGTDVNLAAMTAENAAQHNAFFLIPLALLALKAIDIALTANELYEIYEALESDDPAAGQEMLEEWLLEQAAGGLIGKAIPGFKTFDEMLDWLKRNDVLSPKMLKDLKDNVDSGKLNQPSGEIKVQNATVDKLDTKVFDDDYEFIATVSGGHAVKKNDGYYGEQIAKQIFDDSTGLDFTDIVKNKSNHGADLIGIDDANGTIWLVEVKSSIRDKFPKPDSLNLTDRGKDWIDKVATGFLNGQAVTPEAKAYAIKVRDLLDPDIGGYTLKPILAKVSVPRPGTSGVATVKTVPAG